MVQDVSIPKKFLPRTKLQIQLVRFSYQLGLKLAAFCLLVIGVSLSTAAIAHANTYAIVTGGNVNVRSAPEINYSNRLFMVERGYVVRLHDIAGDFFRADISGVGDVYISREWVRVSETGGTVSAPFAWLYILPPEEGGEAVSMLANGTEVTVVSVYDNWFGVEFMGQGAFIGQAYVEIPHFVSPSDLPTARLGNSLGDEVVSFAMNYLGTRYVWGGASPSGFDCSGFVTYVMGHFGVSLNRRSADMALNGTPVARHEHEPGDLLFFSANGSSRISHVGIYIGGGQFIHSSTNATGVIISCLSTAFNTRNYVTARRVL